MPKLSSRKPFFACLALALLSTIVFAVSRPTPRRPVKVTYQYSNVRPDGTRIPGATHVRILAKGQMRRQEYVDGKLFKDQYIGADGTVYGVSHKRRELNAANLAAKFNLSSSPETAESLMSHPQFHRTEQVLGITAYVFRINNDEGKLIHER